MAFVARTPPPFHIAHYTLKALAGLLDALSNRDGFYAMLVAFVLAVALLPAALPALMLLVAVGIDRLAEVPLAVEESDPDERQGHVAGRFHVIAGENAETAGIADGCGQARTGDNVHWRKQDRMLNS